MKIIINLLVLASILMFTSCDKSEFSDDIPATPASVSVDIDEDGEADYIMEYSHNIIFSEDNDELITGVFNPLNENEVLLNEEAQNLFLRNLEEVQDSVSSPLFWNNIGFKEKLVSIVNNNNGQWPNQWDLETDNDHSSYFLGLKLKSNDTQKLGWIEFEINTENGEFSIIDKGVL